MPFCQNHLPFHKSKKQQVNAFFLCQQNDCGQMAFDKMTVDKMTVDKMTVDEMTVSTK